MITIALPPPHHHSEASIPYKRISMWPTVVTGDYISPVIFSSVHISSKVCETWHAILYQLSWEISCVCVYLCICVCTYMGTLVHIILFVVYIYCAFAYSRLQGMHMAEHGIATYICTDHMYSIITTDYTDYICG